MALHPDVAYDESPAGEFSAYVVDIFAPWIVAASRRTARIPGIFA